MKCYRQAASTALANGFNNAAGIAEQWLGAFWLRQEQQDYASHHLRQAHRSGATGRLLH
ncbi:MAG: hypothetical protein ACI9WS_002272 [Paraglaciecola psychrophila]|jgi:hypothetical protein